MSMELSVDVMKKTVRSGGNRVRLGYLAGMLHTEGYRTKGIRKFLDLKGFKMESTGRGAFFVSPKGRNLKKKARKRESTIAKVNFHFRDGRSSNLEIICEICENLGFRRPASITQGKEILKSVYINIFDYVDKNYKLQFSSRRALARYSKKNRKIFPKRKAKSENLKYLLKVMF